MDALANTQTLQNLFDAIIRESQLSTSYNLFSEVALNENYWDISLTFGSLSLQEKQHYELFLNFVPADLQGQITSSNNSFIISSQSTLKNLQSAMNSENVAMSEYPQFAITATNEGFPDISQAFTNVTSIEKYHYSIFEKMQYNIVNNEDFQKDRVVIWQCQACGFIIESEQAPSPCPVCGNVGSYKYIGDSVALYLAFLQPDGTPKNIIIESEDPDITKEDINNKMTDIITSGVEGTNLTKDSATTVIQTAQRFNMSNS